MSKRTDDLNNERTLQEERRYVELMGQLQELEIWYEQLKRKNLLIPADWHRVERDVPVRRPLEKVSLRLDCDVIKWFRAMGFGHQRRINQVLRSFMLAVLSREIETAGNRDWKGEPIRGG